MTFWKMISLREICLVILFITTASVSALYCPANSACSCQLTQSGGSEIFCVTPISNGSFNIRIEENRYIKVSCINSPKWSDFHSGISPPIECEKVEFINCDLPDGNNSLGDIVHKVGAINVAQLNFESGKKLNLEKRHLNDFENLKGLVLSNNNISDVKPNLLANLRNLTYLNLLSNNLHLRTAGFFDYTPELQTIELGDNNLKLIPPGTFDKLKNLTFLNLWKARLTELQRGVFDGLVALKSLDLHWNYLTTLPKDVFAKLENLEVLNLFGNNFTDLPKHLLRNNMRLHTIKLFDNKRNMTFPGGLFSNLTNLQVLRLDRNGLITLPEDLFWGSSSLTNITLNRNYLKSLPFHIFRDLKNLKALELSFNDIENLPDRIFSNTIDLVKLDLSKNRIASISGELFYGLYKLQELNMEQNHLRHISDRSFNFLTKLKIIKLSNNYLTLQSTFFDYIDPLIGTISPFHDCIDLEELHLANNNISKIFGDWITTHVQLHKLDLRYNNISSIKAGDLQFVSDNIRVDLTHNKIQHILLHDAESIAMAQKSKHRNVIISVENNPLSCDCDMYDFLRYMEGEIHPHVHDYFHIEPGNLNCHSPEELKNLRIDVLSSQQYSKNLTCRLKNTDSITVCSEKCDCFVRPMDKAFLFDCTHKNLTSVPKDIKEPDISSIRAFTQSIDSISYLALNFSHNWLMHMPNLKTMKLESVEKLVVSHNNISEISLDGLNTTIKVLELHNNNILRIPPKVLDFLKNSTHLNTLTLHENPWICDCDAKDFLNFIQTKFQMISEVDKVMCDGNNMIISEMTVTDFCPFDTAAIISISVAIALLGLIIGTFGLLYYKYQEQIKIWLFAHQWCLWFVTEEELDKDKQYDAFVSFSHKDDDFIMDELVPKLESGPTPFKLCLHYRDWLAGEWIPDNIARSVENSRRTIVVLSPNFLDSVWGRMEFRAAHCQALSDGRARVILILYGDIGPTNDLDPELKAYLSMNTYVEWGDPWFWDKLRYALPHQRKLSTKSTTVGKKIFENHQLYIQANGDKKELYPVALPETPATSTPPADSLKMFICDDKKSEEESSLNDFAQESCKLNGDIRIILAPDQITKHSSAIDNKEFTV
ncbi:protein toll isoform X1 [Linepithema humile]|uniref:protein toll isoform X1 n=2 Tax=Linepithema humile TaxID=83485 RepID=UPI00351E91C4